MKSVPFHHQNNPKSTGPSSFLQHNQMVYYNYPSLSICQLSLSIMNLYFHVMK